MLEPGADPVLKGVDRTGVAGRDAGRVFQSPEIERYAHNVFNWRGRIVGGARRGRCWKVLATAMSRRWWSCKPPNMLLRSVPDGRALGTVAPRIGHGAGPSRPGTGARPVLGGDGLSEQNGQRGRVGGTGYILLNERDAKAMDELLENRANWLIGWVLLSSNTKTLDEADA